MAAVLEGLEPEETAAAAEDAARSAVEAVESRPGAPFLLVGNQLNLDVHPGGCHRLQYLCSQQPPELLQVEFLRLSTHEDPRLLDDTLAQVPWSLLRLRSLVLKGGQSRGALGACLHGTLTTLPAGLSDLACCLAHLDLSFNRLETLPPCILELRSLDALLLSHNRLSELPEVLGALPALTFLSVRHNCLEKLPATLGSLSALQRLDLSENLLDTIPSEIGNLSNLSELNLASNRLQNLPASLAGLRSLRLLVLHSNLLTSVPTGLAHLPLITRLDLRDNQLRDLPAELLDAPFVRVQGNPLGEASPAPPSPPDISQIPEMPRLFLTSDLDSFLVTPHGCSVTLACGVRLQFPAGATTTPITIHYRLWLPEPHLVSLGPHDFLLSGVLELQPHGVAFQQRLWARCQVPHFSWFLVVLRPVSNTCLLPPEGALLCSSGHPGVKVTFPSGATEEPRQVSMQSGPPSFLQPVTVQLPLPPGVTGFSLDRSHLHLLYRTPSTATWDDITTQVVLELTHLYARFQVTHFSWYWLWYTTKTCVGGLARKAWERLRLHRVNLIALQRRRDPEQVLLQCLPRNKVDATLCRLMDRYRGPEPSDTVEMFEGEKFFAAFERGIDVDADRPDCVDGRICFVFYSHLKNVKEVYITTALDREAQAVRGQVSFYRGSLPVEVPQEAEAARQRKGTDALWMATLPIKLPVRLERRELTGGNRVLGDDLDGQIRHMLFSWAERQAGQPGAVGHLVQALEQSDRQDVAEEVRAILELGRHKYQDSIRRTGLAPEDSPLPGTSASQTPKSAQA
ncbi:hypothetical protein ACRRTK_011195 [Alexandromys fortis]